MFDDDDFGDDFGDGFDDSFADSLKGEQEEHGSSQLGPTETEMPEKEVAPMAWYQIWIQAVTQPNEASYQQLLRQPDVSVDRAYMWVVAASVVTSLVLAPLQIGLLAGFDSSVLPYLLCGIPAFALFSIIGFALSTGATYGIARIFDGKGSYAEHSFLYAAITAPYSLVTILSAIPILGLCISLLGSLYGLFLMTLAIKTAHRFDWGRAIASLLLLVGIFFVITFCGTFALLTLLGPAIGEVFTEIERNLALTPVP